MRQTVINTTIIQLTPPSMRILFQPWHSKLNHFSWTSNANQYTVLFNIKQPWCQSSRLPIKLCRQIKLDSLSCKCWLTHLLLSLLCHCWLGNKLSFQLSNPLSHSYLLLILLLYYPNQLSNLFFQGHLWLSLTPRRLTAGHISQESDFFINWSS